MLTSAEITRDPMTGRDIDPWEGDFITDANGRRPRSAQMLGRLLAGQVDRYHGDPPLVLRRVADPHQERFVPGRGVPAMTRPAKDFLPGSAFEPRRTQGTTPDLRKRPDLNPGRTQVEPRGTQGPERFEPRGTQGIPWVQTIMNRAFSQVNDTLPGFQGSPGFRSPLTPRTATTSPVQAPHEATNTNTDTDLNRAGEHQR